MPAWLIGAAIGAAQGIIGGIMGRRSAKADRRQALKDEKTRFIRLRESALAGGFDPLAVLRAGYFGPDIPTGNLGADRMIGLVNGAFDTGLNVASYVSANRLDTARLSLDRERLDLDRRMIEHDMAMAERYAAQGRAPGFAPGGSSPVGYSGGVISSDSATLRLPGGSDIMMDPGTDGAEVVEQRYGDFMQAVIGAGIFISDTAYTLAQQARTSQRPTLGGALATELDVQLRTDAFDPVRLGGVAGDWTRDAISNWWATNMDQGNGAPYTGPSSAPRIRGAGTSSPLMPGMGGMRF